MKCHILFSEKNKKNISKCRLLKILPRVLSVSVLYFLTSQFFISQTTAVSNQTLFSPILGVCLGLDFGITQLKNIFIKKYNYHHKMQWKKLKQQKCDLK